MKKVIVDTNALLRFFLNDIPDQNKLVAALLQQAKDLKIKIYVPQIVVFELVFVLESYYEVTKNKTIDTLQTLVATTYLEIESRNIFIKALALYGKNNCSLVDCFLVAQSQMDEADLFTFDKKIKRLLTERE